MRKKLYTSSDEDEDDFDDEFGSESSEGIGRNGRRYKDAPRRSTRARISRYDKDFSKLTFIIIFFF